MELSVLGEALSEKSTAEAREKALTLYQMLRVSVTGWKSFKPLTVGSAFFEIHPQLQFATLVFLQDHVKLHFDSANEVEKAEFRECMQKFLYQIVTSPNHLTKLISAKLASFLSTFFVVEYPHQWKTFFSDVILLKDKGMQGLELYLTLLKEINCELADRQISRSEEEVKRNTLIKDTMRDDCVAQLADSWKQILKGFLQSENSLGFDLDQENAASNVVSLCLNVMAGYIQWIEICEIVNDEVVSMLLSLCFKRATRKSAIETIDAICCKGMLPESKLQLIDNFYSVLTLHKLLEISSYDAEDEDDVEFLCSLSAFVNSTILQFADIFKEFARKDFSVANAAMLAIENKNELILELVSHEDDDVSKAILSAARELISIYRQVTMTPERKIISQRILCALIKKYKYEPDFNFADLREDENDFFVYRQDLKVLFENLAKLDNLLVTEFVQNCFMNAVPSWRSQPFQDVELAINLLYLLGESLPHVSGNIFSNESPCTAIICSLLQVLVESNVNQFDHPSVSLMFHETVVRYDKFFAFNPQHIPAVLESFTGASGVVSKYPQVRGRCSYLFCRFIKLLKSSITPHRDTLLSKIESVIQTVLMLDDNPDENPLKAGQMQPTHLENEDSQFLFEAVGMLICMCAPENAPVMMSSVLRPINARISQYADRLMQPEMTSQHNHLNSNRQIWAQKFSAFVSFATRLSKAFANNQAVEASGCCPCLIETLEIVLKGLRIKCVSATSDAALVTSSVYIAVRQYLHRMVICLPSDVILHYVKVTMQYLLEAATSVPSGQTGGPEKELSEKYSLIANGITEFIPLVNQVVARYKKQSIEMLGSIFVPLLQVFSMIPLSPHSESSSSQSSNGGTDSSLDNTQGVRSRTISECSDVSMREMRSQIKRSYFTFINTILHNDAFPVIACQGHSVVWTVLQSVADGALHFPDPVTQKLCFSILGKFIEVANGETEMGGGSSCGEIRKFAFSHVMPACFAVCCSPSFNCKDAQSNMALMEAGGALKCSYDKYGESVVDYLTNTYLPSQNIPNDRINELAVAIRSFDNKKFRDFYKDWINKLLS